MIDPLNITKFDRTDAELEEFISFAVLVAGKPSNVIAPRIPQVFPSFTLSYFGESPLSHIRRLGEAQTANRLRNAGIGCYNQKAHALFSLAENRFDLRTVPASLLETIRWIKYKTSRFFIVYSRPGARYAILDTHVLKALRYYLPANIPVPKSTPTSPKEYTRLENHFLHLADMFGRSPLDLDKEFWVTFQDRTFGDPRPPWGAKRP